MSINAQGSIIDTNAMKYGRAYQNVIKKYRKEGRAAYKKKKREKQELIACPKCNRFMKKSVCDIQIENKRPDGAECFACISGIKRIPLEVKAQKKNDRVAFLKKVNPLN